MTSVRQFSVLDGMRGVAAIIVLQRHAGEGLDTPYFSAGYLAVDFFFALSGFVLAYAYDERLRDGMSAARFMLLRLIRLYPLYLVGVLLLVVASPTIWPHASRQLPVALALLPDPSTPERGWLVLPAWSLAFELLANLVFALSHRHVGNRALACVIAISGVALVFIALRNDGLDVGYTVDTIFEGAVRAAFSFSLGVLIFRNRTVFDRWPTLTAAIPLLALAVVLAMPAVPWIAWRDVLVVIFAFPALLVLGSRANASPKGRWWVVQLGAASYAIYVLHSGAVALLQAAGFHKGLGVELVFMVVVVVACALVDRYLDQPIRRWLTTRLVRPKVTSPA